MHANPYQDMNLQQIYDGLVSGQFGPRWPSEELQKGYVGTNKIDLLRRTFSFIDILDKDGAFKPGWKGLDYGCGWGRFASTLLSKGTPEQLDLCDAWPHTIKLIGKLGYQNHIFSVPEILSDGDLEKQKYDFALSFSVFTHLVPAVFNANIPVLRSSLKPGGKLYITVRHEDFLDHFYKERAGQMREILNREGVVFTSSDGKLGTDNIFGHTTVTPEYMAQLGGRYIGQPHSLQEVYVFSA